MKEDHSLIPIANTELIEQSGVNNLLELIRPEWQGKRLIQRVNNLLFVDPSSACQRIFNASLYDLREKIVVAGIDIASEAAIQYKLPPVSKSEDVENYSVSKIIDLAYRIGILSRPEWRKMLRVYDIRRDLEHEDEEYEAGVEDCVYIFKTCIEAVLSKDPIELLKLTEVKEIVEEPTAVTVSQALLDDYDSLPQPRQLEIYKFLISNALNNEYPDVVRQNCYNVLCILKGLTPNQVIIDVAKWFNSFLKRKAPSLAQARVAYAGGVLPYLKKSQLKEFYEWWLNHMNNTGYTFGNYNSHGELLRNFKEVGGLEYCPQELQEKILEWLVMCYIGEPGGYGQFGKGRSVFYSNIGAPLALEIIKNNSSSQRSIFDKFEKSNSKIKRACNNEHVARRYQTILDIVEG